MSVPDGLKEWGEADLVCSLDRDIPFEEVEYQLSVPFDASQMEKSSFERDSPNI